MGDVVDALAGVGLWVASWLAVAIRLTLTVGAVLLTIWLVASALGSWAADVPDDPPNRKDPPS